MASVSGAAAASAKVLFEKYSKETLFYRNLSRLLREVLLD